MTILIKPIVFFTFILLLPHTFSEKEKQIPICVSASSRGISKGDKFQGIHALKNYLQHFGYLSSETHHVHTDTFDEQLESALKTYQLNYNLQVTGVVDATTIAEMSKPRCGVPDIIDGTTRMRSGQQKHHHQHDFHTVSHYSFFPGSPRWTPSKYQLTYAIHPNASNAVNPVDRAFRTWAASTQFRFYRVANFQRADIKVSYEKGDHGDGYPFDGPLGRVIAHAFAPTEGRFHYDGDESYAWGAVPGTFDLESVALHEIGHLLGLGHSSVQAAVMVAGIAQGTTKTRLHPDDIAGVRALYNF